jgi:cytochrome c-type biogenesis protein CcmH/NrfG
MPELLPELIVALLGLAAAAAVVVPPLFAPAPPQRDPELEAAELRRRVAIDALRDVEADHRAGSLDDAAYADQRADAEARVAAVGVGWDARRAAVDVRPSDPAVRRAVAGWAGAIGILLVLGLAVPAPIGLANATLVDDERAAAQAAETTRQGRIAALLDQLRDDPLDAEVLSALADAYLAGGSPDELARAAAALTLVISQRPDDVDAHARIITAYLRAGDYANARAALDAYTALEPDPADVDFFSGIIALRGDRDGPAAVAAFDRFLAAAPDDPRAPMVRALRAEAIAAGD